MKGLFGEVSSGNKLQDRFVVPPFSVLDTRQGYWQARKRQWLDLGIESELGRDVEAYQSQDKLLGIMRGKHAGVLHKATSGTEGKYESGDCWKGSGSSIFDPVLCELAYKWFCRKGGLILDPFAGGSARGIVATYLGYDYIGVDLNQRQIEANKKQAGVIVPNRFPKWIIGDSCELSKLVDEKVDFIFSCPPYYNLEQYSCDPLDLSNAGSYLEFRIKYVDIIRQCYERLRCNRFACFVIGDIRDKQGYYYNLVADTKMSFIEVGFKLYNEAVLINTAGSLPIRVSKAFPQGRKLGKSHQNILIFIKGEWRNAVKWLNVNGGSQ